MKPIVIVGGGGHAKVLIGEIRRLDGFDILGYVAREDAGKILNVSCLGTDEILASIIYAKPGCTAAIGIGAIEPSEKRKTIFDRLIELGFACPPVISGRACVGEDVVIEEAAVIFAGAVINPGTRLGRGCIINTNATVEHDCRIDEFSHIAPGATLSGNVHVGGFSLIGTGASVRQGIKIGAKCLIGAGAAVVRDCEGPGRYVGVPARRIP